MYDAIKFFGSPKELLAFTANLNKAEYTPAIDNKLPVFKGYTVDYRLRQFRACPEGWNNHGTIEFVDFDSDEGDELLSEMIRRGFVPNDILVELF